MRTSEGTPPVALRAASAIVLLAALAVSFHFVVASPVIAGEPVPTASIAPSTIAPSSAPSRTPDIVVAPGDPRSEGEGPGLVGSPIAILLGVVALGIATAATTALIARLRDHR